LKCHDPHITLISLTAEEGGINEEGIKTQKTDTWIEKLSSKEGGKKFQKQ
jgi:hypothetical protein